MSFLMDEGTNELLAKVRARIEGDFFEAEEDEEEYECLNIDSRAMEVLERVRAQLESDLGEGTGQATNTSDVDDALDRYMNTILNHLVTEYGMDQDAAIDFILGVADKLAASGDLPPMPSEGSSDEDVAFWIGKATTAGFESAVIAAVA